MTEIRKIGNTPKGLLPLPISGGVANLQISKTRGFWGGRKAFSFAKCKYHAENPYYFCCRGNIQEYPLDAVGLNSQFLSRGYGGMEVKGVWGRPTGTYSALFGEREFVPQTYDQNRSSHMSGPLIASGSEQQTYHPGPVFNHPAGIKTMSAYKVLVVDDEEDIVDEVVELLEGEDIVAFGVNDAKKALDLIAADDGIAVVLSDIRMPGMDGLEMARHVRSGALAQRDLSVIIMTGHAGMAEAVEALQIGAEDFLTKPINSDQLLHAVRRGLETVRLRQRDRNYTEDLSAEVRRKTEQAVALSREIERKNVELQEKNRELEISAKLKDEFLGMISHELNTPLNAMIGFAHILESQLQASGNDKDRESAQCIIDAGERLMKNVKSILCLADIQAGRITANKQETLVNDLIESAISAEKNVLDQKSAHVEVDLPDPSLLAFVDPLLMKTALTNILNNAAKFSENGASISVQGKDDGDNVVLSVKDAGPGIAAEVLSAALEPFRQVDGSLQRSFEGMGLGLPLAHKIANLHGGGLDVDSAPGQGATIRFILPKGASV